MRAETEERGREVERTKVQAVAAIERRKTVEEELFGAKEQLVLLQVSSSVVEGVQSGFSKAQGPDVWDWSF